MIPPREPEANKSTESLKKDLKAGLEKARKEHEESLKKDLELAKKTIEVNASLGDFEKNKDIVSSFIEKCSSNQIEDLKKAIKKAESDYLNLEFQKFIKLKKWEELEKLLADIHVRVSEKEYANYEKILKKAQTPNAFLESLKNIAKKLSKLERRIFSKKEPISREENLVKKPFKERVVDYFEKEKLYWKRVGALLFKEYNGEKVDPFDLTRDVIQKTNKASQEMSKDYEEDKSFFHEDQTEQDILDTILDQKKKKEEGAVEKGKENKGGQDGFVLEDLDGDEEEDVYVNPFIRYVSYAYNFMIIGLVVLSSSWLFFFIQQDEENRVLSLVQQDNLYVQKEVLKNSVIDLEKKIKIAEKDMKEIASGTRGIASRVVVNEIQSQKIDWIGLRTQLHNATLDAFPYNNILQYIRYTSFTGDSTKNEISISGDITDPSGRVFLHTTKLINAINNHPAFSGAEMKTFSKTKNNDEEIGGFVTNFSLKLQYKKVELEEEKK